MRVVIVSSHTGSNLSLPVQLIEFSGRFTSGIFVVITSVIGYVYLTRICEVIKKSSNYDQNSLWRVVTMWYCFFYQLYLMFL